MLPIRRISSKDNLRLIATPNAIPSVPKPNMAIRPWNGPANRLTSKKAITKERRATFIVCRKLKIIIGKGHKKLTSVPNKGIYRLAKNNIAVIAERKAPSTIDFVGMRSFKD